jgi:hypothetical protein
VAADKVQVPVTVYPGVFPKEYQVTLTVGGREISANVSEQFVRLEGDVDKNGVQGYLTVTIVDRTGDQVMISLPGEVLGAPSRVRLPEKELQVA